MGASLKLTAYEVENSVSVPNNTSRLYVKLEITTKNGTYNHTGDTLGTVTVNGQSFSLDGAYVDYNCVSLLYEATHTITHSADGTKRVPVSASFDPNTPGTSRMTVAQTVELTPIPRASAIGVSDADIGSVATVSVVRRSSAYTHTVSYAFGSRSGYLNADGSHSDTPVQMTQSSIPFLLPESFYDEIPDAKSGICVLTCRTFLGSTQIGEDQSARFTVTAREGLCGPVISGTAADSNQDTLALTGSSARLVRYASTVQCAAAAEARKGASLVRVTIGDVEGDTRTIEGMEEERLVFTAVDSRGYTAACTLTPEMVPYIVPTVQLTARRTDPTSGRAVLQVWGNFYNGSFGQEENQLQLTCRVGEQELVLTPVSDGNSYTAQLLLEELDYRSAHTITVTAADKLTAAEKSVTVGKGIPVFDWGEQDFNFHVPVHLPDPTEDSHGVHRGYVTAALADHTPNAHTHDAGAVTAGVLEAERLPTVPVARGGTGATTAQTARQNLGLGAAVLYTGALQSGSETLSGNFSGYFVVGYTVSGNARVGLFLPAALCDGATRYQLYADGAYINFTVSPSAITIGTASSGGAITAVYGVN